MFARLARYAPRGRLAAWLAGLSVLWLVPGGIGVYAGTAALGCLVLAGAWDLLLLPSRASLTITREFPETLGLGDETRGHYLAINHTSRTIIVQLQDRFPLLLRGGLEFCEFRVGAGAQQKLEFAATGISRGAADLGAVGVRCRTPLGLLTVSFRHDLNGGVRVVPSTSGVRLSLIHI